MKRDIERLATAGKEAISDRQNLSVVELQEIYQIYKGASNKGDGIYYALMTAFYVGYAIGSKAKTK